MSKFNRQSSRPAVIAQQSEYKNYYAIGAGVCVGTAFGFLLEKAKVATPALIRSQMQFSNYTMMYVFIAASATGTLSAYFLKYLGVHEKRSASATALGLGLMGGYGANVLGGMGMGFAMVLGGSCPGTAAAALGGGIWTGGAVMVGGVFGAMAFAHFRKFVQKRQPAFHQKSRSVLVDEHLGVSHMTAAVVAATAMSAFLYALNLKFPWKQGLMAAFSDGAVVDTTLSLRADAWNPIIAGALIGCLQVPSFIFLDRYLGASSCYVSAACMVEEKVVGAGAAKRTPYYANYFTFTDIGQAGTVIGIAVGAYLSAHLSGDSPLAVPPMDVPNLFRSLAGGFLLLFSARLAGGCASGHGLSGMARLSWGSFLVVGGMFAGGALGAGLLL